MPTTVNTAFNEFMKETVNLDSTKTKTARSSRDFLKETISTFDDFFPLYSDKNIDFGSFSRRTKIRPLDDLDMIFTLSAHGCTWTENLDGSVYITAPANSPEYKNYLHDNTNNLNSRMIINRFIKDLSSVKNYDRAELHRNLNAATLKLKSYEWNFDIVPAFFTMEDIEGKTYYIIPDGSGNWLKTDPRLDRNRATEVNKLCDGHMLNAIRAIKYWQRRSTMPSMKSYLLETMIINYFEENQTNTSSFVDLNITNILAYIKDNIWRSVNDPKGIQGNLNTLSMIDKEKISCKAGVDWNTAKVASDFESNGKHKEAISEWYKIFGEKFPTYG